MHSHSMELVLAVEKIYETTSPKHPLNAKQIIMKLDTDYHIECNSSKTIYKCRNILENLGYKFESCSIKNLGGYMVGHFKLWESVIRLYTVSQSKAISDEQKEETISAIKNNLPEEYRQMISKLPIIKSKLIPFDLQATEYMDTVIKAIARNKMVMFRYVSYEINMAPRFKHEKFYYISPYMIYPSNDTVYMIGGEYEEDEDIDKLKHFRFDKMFGVEETDLTAIELSHFTSKGQFQSLSDYVSKCIDNYGEEEIFLELYVTYSEAAMNILKDKCGEEYYIRVVDEMHSIIRFKIRNSPTLIGWLMQNARYFKVLCPQTIIDTLKEEYQFGLSQYL